MGQVKTNSHILGIYFDLLNLSDKTYFGRTSSFNAERTDTMLRLGNITRKCVSADVNCRGLWSDEDNYFMDLSWLTYCRCGAKLRYLPPWCLMASNLPLVPGEVDQLQSAFARDKIVHRFWSNGVKIGIDYLKKENWGEIGLYCLTTENVMSEKCLCVCVHVCVCVCVHRVYFVYCISYTVCFCFV